MNIFRWSWPATGILLMSAAALAVAQDSVITPTAQELNKSFNADAAQWTQRFEHEGRAIYDKRFEILEAMGLKPGLDVADIGAGSGLISRLIAQRVAPDGTVYAVDIAKNMVDHIAKTAEEEKSPNLKAVLGERALAPLGPQLGGYRLHYRRLPPLRIPQRHAG